MCLSDSCLVFQAATEGQGPDWREMDLGEGPWCQEQSHLKRGEIPVCSHRRHALQLYSCMCAETNWGRGKSSDNLKKYKIWVSISLNYILGDPRMCGQDHQERHATPFDRAKPEGERHNQVAERSNRVQRCQWQPCCWEGGSRNVPRMIIIFSKGISACIHCHIFLGRR